MESSRLDRDCVVAPSTCWHGVSCSLQVWARLPFKPSPVGGGGPRSLNRFHVRLGSCRPLRLALLPEERTRRCRYYAVSVLQVPREVGCARLSYQDGRSPSLAGLALIAFVLALNVVQTSRSSCWERRCRRGLHVRRWLRRAPVGVGMWRPRRSRNTARDGLGRGERFRRANELLPALMLGLRSSSRSGSTARSAGSISGRSVSEPITPRRPRRGRRPRARSRRRRRPRPGRRSCRPGAGASAARW